jgi:hypothetical protein
VGVGTLDHCVGVEVLVGEEYARTVHANTNIIFSKGRNYQRPCSPKLPLKISSDYKRG